ncbi:hypothetical protein NEIRO03_1910 [Nematocida sp. AWRm78]|nr:hypothetical protein NEIRO03_1910 [Nematocida sp. AWRm78]
MELIDIDGTLNLQEGINIKPPKPLANLETNILYIQVNQRKCLSESRSKDKVITEIRKSLAHTYHIIDIIMKVGRDLDSEDKRKAFYELMGNNHVIMATVYKIRKEFFNSAINVLCEKEGLPELDAKMTSENAMIELCELTDSGECSRLQRALDILMKHGSNLTIVDESGIEQSNLCELDINKDDIKSLQLLTKTSTWNATALSEFLMCSIYGSIFCEATSSNNVLNYSIYNLYNIVFIMAVEGNNTDLETYKKQNIDRIKRYLNGLKNKDILGVRSTIRPSHIYINIKNYMKFNISKFKTNVINNYLKSIDSHVSIIRGESSHTTNEEAQTSNSASSSQHEQKSNEIIHGVINTSNLKEEDITSLSVASSSSILSDEQVTNHISADVKPEEEIDDEKKQNILSSTSSDEQPIADFWSTNNLSIMLIAIAISIIILSVLRLYPINTDKIMNN